MKKIATIILAVVLSAATILNAQSVGINADGSTPETSAMLDVKSTDKGFLAPRMTVAQRDAIDTPAAGLMIYQTDSTPGYYYYSGSVWLKLDAGLTAGQWTTSGSNIYYNTGNVGIGTIAPIHNLDVVGELGIGNQTSNYNNTTSADFGGLVIQNYKQTGVGVITNIVSTGINTGNWPSEMAFHTRISGGAVTEKFRITEGGNVGIGTTSPASKLDITGPNGSAANLENATTNSFQIETGKSLGVNY